MCFFFLFCFLNQGLVINDFTLTLESELALPGRGEPDGWGRALTNPLDSQPKTPLCDWLLREGVKRTHQDFRASHI